MTDLDDCVFVFGLKVKLCYSETCSLLQTETGLTVTASCGSGAGLASLLVSTFSFIFL